MHEQFIIEKITQWDSRYLGRFLSKPDLQLHIDKLVLIQKKVVEFHTTISNWNVVDF